MILTLEEKLDYWRKNGVPGVIWATEGGTGAGGKKGLTSEDLESKLKNGMKDSEIDQLTETKQGNNVIDKYINRKAKEGKHISEMTDGTFDRKMPNGDLCKNFSFDHHTGEQIKI